MLNTLPAFFDPWHFSDLTQQFRGRIKLTEMPVLSEVVLDIKQGAEYELRFFRDDKHRVRIKGQVSALAEMICQRCLERFEIQLSATVSLALTKNMVDADRLPDHVEPMLFESGARLGSAELIENELLLSLPQIARHINSCPEGIRHFTSTDLHPSSSSTRRENSVKASSPFAILATLKKSND